MTVLSDRDLRSRLKAGSIVVSALGENAVQPASIDVTLGGSLSIWHGYLHGLGAVDPRLDQSSGWETVRLGEDGGPRPGGPHWLLWPGNLYLATTQEWIEVPNDLLCHLHGRSSLGRLGILPHQQAGLIDPGYRGRPTLEITVATVTVLRPGDPIGQLTFETLSSPAERPYAGRYQTDADPTPSRLHLEYHP